MKIRSGFVSNSSSSSFVMFASVEAVDVALEECSEVEQLVAKKFLSNPIDFLGQKIYSYSYLSGNCGDEYYDTVRDVLSKFDEDDDNEDAMMDFAFGGFESKVEEVALRLGQTVLSHEEDM